MRRRAGDVNAAIPAIPAFFGVFAASEGFRPTLIGPSRALSSLSVDAFRAWAEIDLDALASNLRRIRQRAGDGVRVMLVVKQDAYGHGAVAVAHHAVRSGVGALGVGSSAEALELRRAGIRLPILILGTVVEEELAACLRHSVHVGLHSSDRCRSLQELASRAAVLARVHLNVDTGMGRLGVPPERALDLLAEVHASSHLGLAGTMTHFASSAGLRDPFTREQLQRFDHLLARARESGLPTGWVHAANSAALFTGLGRESGYDTVRPGLAAFGALSTPLSGRAQGLVPVMSVRTRVVFLKDVAAGTPVGYGSTWRSERATRVATLPIGYGHGLPWRLEGWEVLLGGRRAPIVGRLSMDYTTVDVGHLPGVSVGAVATLLGREGRDELRLEALALRADTVPYELTCALGRLPRVYRGGETVELAAQAPAERGEVPHTGPSVDRPRGAGNALRVGDGQDT